MKKIVIISLTAVFLLKVNRVIAQVIYPIYIKEYDLYLYPDKGCKRMYEIKKGDTLVFNINLNNCKGELHLKLFNNKNHLIEEGNYVTSLALLSAYKIGRVSGRNKMYDEIMVQKYYQPLRHGKWSFYQRIKNQEIYNKGILLHE